MGRWYDANPDSNYTLDSSMHRHSPETCLATSSFYVLMTKLGLLRSDFMI